MAIKEGAVCDFHKQNQASQADFPSFGSIRHKLALLGAFSISASLPPAIINVNYNCNTRKAKFFSNPRMNFQVYAGSPPPNRPRLFL